MRMDRYEEFKDEKDKETSVMSRTEKNQRIYDNAYDNGSVVDLNDFLNKEEEISSDEKQETETQSDNVYVEKNYDVNEYIKKAHERLSPDENVRNLDNQEFIEREDKITRIIESIDEQHNQDDFFSELIGDNEDTMVEGQLRMEDVTESDDNEELYIDDLHKNVLEETKLEKAIGSDTMTQLAIKEDDLNNTFRDLFKSSVISERRKRKWAITIFSVTLFMLIIVILIIIFK